MIVDKNNPRSIMDQSDLQNFPWKNRCLIDCSLTCPSKMGQAVLIINQSQPKALLTGKADSGSGQFSHYIRAIYNPFFSETVLMKPGPKFLPQAPKDL